jgi:hypothetical protein
MSPQPSRIGKFPQPASGLGEDLVFGRDPQSSLVIPKALIGRLWAHVNEGTRILARGGLEVGGLLVGPKVLGGPVLADEIIPVPIEYRYGPVFHMSASDLAAIQPAMEAVQEDPSKTVVGLYRGRPRGETTLRPSDEEILDVIERVHPSFAEDFRCFFVLAPMSESMALACITMREGGGWGEMQPFTMRSNPFAIIALPPSAAVQQMARNLPTEQHAIQPYVSSSLAQPPAEEHAAEHRAPEQRIAEHDAGPVVADRWVIEPARIWLYAAACLVVVGLAIGGGYRWARGKQPAPAPAVPAEKADASRAHLGFSATRDGTVWKLSWDRAAMDALNPVGAVLSIEDGGYLQQLPLAPADLASGILFYTPQSNDLTFGLRIDRGGAHVEEQVRVLAPTRAPFDRAAQFVPAKPPVQAPAATPTNAQPPAAVASTTVPTPSANPPPRRFVLPATTPGGSASASVSENPVPQPPVVALAVPVAPNLTRLTPDFGPLPAPPAPIAPATAAPVVPSASPVPPSTPSPAAAAQSLANYVGPRPTRQVSPSAPSVLPPGVSQVVVMVEIDVHGQVTKATPIGWTPANAALMISATRAASSWAFAPAQLNGHVVPSQMNLIFKF